LRVSQQRKKEQVPPCSKKKGRALLRLFLRKGVGYGREKLPRMRKDEASRGA